MSNHIHNIVHLTSVHTRYDTRIFLKMCASLAKASYKVTLVVADGKGAEFKNNVEIMDVGCNKGGRLLRMTKTVQAVFKKAKELNGQIYHLHDPELIPIGIKLKKLGKTVIFDAHEDLPQQILTKPYLNPFLLKLVSYFAKKYEQYSCARFDGVITATPAIKNKFLKINKNTLDINNYPLAEELSTQLPWDEKRNEVAYVGGISSIRGIKELVQSCSALTTTTKLSLVGTCSDANLYNEIKQYDGWKNVNELGFLDREQVKNILSRSMAGLVTFLPVPNHVNSQPNKMFEYMSAGIPVIASNFPLWKDIIERNGCGLCVDPVKPQSIAQAIDYVISNPDRAKEMGENGRNAVLDKYNWGKEELKLMRFYNNLLKDRH